MEKFIVEEALLMLDSMYIGLVIMAFYDVLRLLRRIVRHKNIIVNLEDFIFWIIAGFVVFSLVYSENDGSLRWFIVAFVFLGGFIYEKSFGRFLVKFTSKYVNKILNIILKKPLAKAIMCIRNIFRRVVADNVKKLCKKEKIS